MNKEEAKLEAKLEAKRKAMGLLPSAAARRETFRQSLGLDPTKSKALLVEVDPKLHAAVKIAAAKQGVSMQKVVVEALKSAGIVKK